MKNCSHFLSDHISSRSVKSVLVVTHSHFGKTVVGHLVHQTVQHNVRSLCSYAVLA